MPEILEVEAYRRLAESVVGRTVSAVEAPDPLYPKGGADAVGLADALVDHVVAVAAGHDDPLCRESAVAALGAPAGTRPARWC